jgi:methyl-accepting chemotaxis protein
MRLTVRNKLFAGFGVVLALMVVLGVMAISGLSTVSQKADAMYADSTVPLARIAVARATYNANTTLMRDLILEQSHDGMSRIVAEMKANSGAISENIAEASKRFSAEDKAVLEQLLTDQQAFRTAREPIIQLALAGDDGEATRRMRRELDPLGQQMVDSYAKLFDLQVREAGAGNTAIKATSSSQRTLTLVLLAVAILSGAAVAFFIARGISNGIKRMLAAAVQIGAGDLTVDVSDVRSKDEIGDMAVAFQRMGEKLRETIAQVSASANVLASASQQMASTSEEAGRAVTEIANAVSDVATGAERQVRMVEQSQQAAVEVANAVQESAQNAQATAEAANDARMVAREGVDAAEEASAAMRSVRESTESVTSAINVLAGKSVQIGGIVATITGIAGQTNLLALNAAIEAARAGDQGRGFAVVAEEVRKLAEESQQAAATIAELVGEIQSETEKTVAVVEDGSRRTESGAEVVEQTRQAFAQIGESVDAVTARVEQIAAGAQQVAAAAARMQGDMNEVASLAAQSSASSEQVSASTEETSASTQEIAASAQELARTAEELERLVQQFKVTA